LRRHRVTRHQGDAGKTGQQCENRDPSRLHPAPLPSHTHIDGVQSGLETGLRFGENAAGMRPERRRR
jgi:hypothetical protein